MMNHDRDLSNLQDGGIFPLAIPDGAFAAARGPSKRLALWVLEFTADWSWCFFLLGWLAIVIQLSGLSVFIGLEAPAFAVGPDSPEIGYFIYIGTMTCTNGVRIQSYKHSVTRHTLHIDAGGRFYRYDGKVQPSKYEARTGIAAMFKLIRTSEQPPGDRQNLRWTMAILFLFGCALMAAAAWEQHRAQAEADGMLVSIGFKWIQLRGGDNATMVRVVLGRKGCHTIGLKNFR